MSTSMSMWILISLAALVADAGTPPEPVRRCAGGEATRRLEEGRQLQREEGRDGADGAVALYEQALQADAACADALWELGWSHQLRGDWKAALGAWERLRALAPEYPQLDQEYASAQERAAQAEALARLPEVGTPEEQQLQPSEGAPIELTAVGDVHMGSAWPPRKAVLPPRDGADLWTDVADLLAEAPILFGNLETVLADGGESRKCRRGSTRCFSFRVPTRYARTLREAGFDVVSVANNHTGDFGTEGRKATLVALDEVGILHSGPVGDVARWEHQGSKLALVAFSTGPDVYRIQEVETARRVVAELARSSDLVIVSFHGGAEGDEAQRVSCERETFHKEDRGNVCEFARGVIDAGADLVLGHGPHVLRGIELYRGRLILYSMGNFSSWETFGLKGQKGVSGLFRISLAPNGVALGLEVVPLYLEPPGRPKRDPERRAIGVLRDLSQRDFGDALLDEQGRWRRPQAP